MLLNRAQLLIVDDDDAMIDVLLAWFDLYGCRPDTARSGIEALQRVKTRRYDVVITDLQMPLFDGHQLHCAIKQVQPEAEVIFLTGTGTMEDAIRALREGRAFDFLQKPIRDFEQFNAVIERALARRQKPAVPMPSHLESLTERERDILGCLAAGLDNAAIAARLCLAEKTVKNHLTHIYEKLQVSSRTQAVLVCQTYGLAPSVRELSAH